MNRRVRWNQTPPNLDEYDPSKLKAQKLAPVQKFPALALPPGSAQQVGDVETPRRAAPTPKTPKVSPKEETAEGGCPSYVCFFDSVLGPLSLVIWKVLGIVFIKWGYIHPLPL